MPLLGFGLAEVIPALFDDIISYSYLLQPKEKVAGVLVAACKAQPYFKRFIDDWATITIMKQALHNFKHNPKCSQQVDIDGNPDDEDSAGEEEELGNEEDSEEDLAA
ncbi:hypothetical protein M422DRAFT_255569 [Sphaerobolus stellatus SS14]|uniref:Uncharacterized protein n=1 Tax=Sphaerobolus stellatus (strain SS14) TaxID=990650 RepID=A0A0C9UEH3_SPHS4|nr:hypothetical protein M422DRAFT_255569 [Sphaerobolus stellatus SS14]